MIDDTRLAYMDDRAPMLDVTARIWVPQLVAEVRRLRAIVNAYPPNSIFVHDYMGGCPDEVEGWDKRDPKCEACRSMMVYEGREFTVDEVV